MQAQAQKFDWAQFEFKVKTTLTSFKFYALLASLAVDYFGFAKGAISAEAAVLAAIGALSVFATGKALEDGLSAGK